MEEHGGLHVAGAILPRLELREVRILERSRLAAEGLGRATVVVWPHGDRGRPEDVCWVGVGRLRRDELGSSIVPPLPAVEFQGRELERLERAGRLATVLRREGLVRTLRYDVSIHGPDGGLERVMWSVGLPVPSRRWTCDGRRHGSGIRG